MTSKPIRRPSRLRAVWLTYWTRPLFWMFLVALALFMPGAWLMWTPRYEQGPGQQPPSIDVKSALPRAPEPAPRANISLKDGGEVQGKEPDWSKLRSLTLYNGFASCRELWTPGAMPGLESLVVWNHVQDASIVRLCEMYDLKSLTLANAGALTATAMEHLSREPRLEFLSLNVDPTWFHSTLVPGELPETLRERERRLLKSLHHAQKLEWPRSLKTLYYEDSAGVNSTRLNEWQRLPHLRCLATQLIPAEGSQLPDETLSVLKRFPQLRQLYLHEYPAASELSVVQQRLLPGIRVRPNSYDPTRGKRASVVLVIGMIVTVLLAIQMSAQFIVPSSLLTPHYARSHVGFVAGVSIVLFIGSFVALLLAGCSLNAALGLSGSSVLILAVGAKLFRQLSSFPLPGFANFGLAMPCVVFPVLGMQFVTGLFGAELDWFLRGQHPWIAFGLLIAAIWGACDLVRWHVDLPRLLEEAGCANVPLGMFDTAGWTEWGRTIVAVREARGKKPPFGMRGRDAELDRFMESLHKRRGTTALVMWRLANAQSTMKFLLFFVAFFIPFAALGAAAMSVSTGSLDLSWLENRLKILWPVMGQMVFMFLLFPFMFAWQRRPMMALELLRPVDRRDWIRTWFQGIAGEMAPVLLVATVLAVIAWSTGQLDHWTLPQLALTGAGALAALALLAAFGLWLLTITSIWWAALGCVIAGAVAFASVFAAALLADQAQPATVPPGAVLLVVLLYALAYAALRFARWRWQNWEVGHIE